VVLDREITNENAVVLYKEPVNLMKQLMMESSEGEMDEEQF